MGVKVKVIRKKEIKYDLRDTLDTRKQTSTNNKEFKDGKKINNKDKLIKSKINKILMLLEYLKILSPIY